MSLPQPLFHLLCCFLLNHALAQTGAASPQEEAFERARIAEQRSQLEASFAAEEAVCQRKFFVNACLNEARGRQREALTDLRRQEVLLDDADRKRKAADQLEKIEEKGSAQRQQEGAEKAQENLRKGVAGAAEAVERAQAQNEKAAQAAERRAAVLAAQARKEAEASQRAALEAQAQARAAALRQRQQEAATRKEERERRLREAAPSQTQPLPARP